MPAYPLVIDAEWKKPIFLPSEVVLIERAGDSSLVFEIWSKDMQHHNLQASVKHVPSLRMTKVEA